MGSGRIEGAALALLLMAMASLTGCSGDGFTEPTPAPTITVEGVEDGGVYTGPVTIRIDVDRGSYSATLDGDPFLSGSTVSSLGDHDLVISARAGEQTTSRTLGFRIEFPEGGALIVRVFDLGDNDAGGGGDAILLTDSTTDLQLHALVDAGPAGEGGTDRDYVADRLRRVGVSTLQALILTHAHSDHFQGMPAVLDAVDVERFVYNGQLRSYNEYNQLIARAEARADTVIVPADLLAIPLGGGTEITVIPPLGSYLNQSNAEASELNEGSVGAAVRRESFAMFLTGDGEVEANRRWRTDYDSWSREVDVLKVGHHGANDAIFDNGITGASSWLDHTSPQVMLISANGTTHPRHNALTKILGRTNTRTYCTNVHGDIELRVDANGTVRVTTERNAEDDCVAGSDATS